MQLSLAFHRLAIDKAAGADQDGPIASNRYATSRYSGIEYGSIAIVLRSALLRIVCDVLKLPTTMQLDG